MAKSLILCGPKSNKYLGCGFKGFFCRNNGGIIENMDKGLTVPKWVLIGWHTFCLPDNFAPWNTLIQGGLVHFASQLTLLLNTLYSLTHFNPQHILLLSTLCSQKYFSPQHTLLQEIIFSSEHYAPWNTLLPRTLCFLCSREQSMLRRTFNKGAKCSCEQNVPTSKVFREAKCAVEQIISGSKVFQGAKCVEKQNDLRSKVWVCKVC